MATYNGQRFITEQLNSIIRQTYSNLEVIIVDDDSTDDTHSILQEFSRKYPFIKVYRNKTNIGYIKNFERGLQMASGNFIAPCDQDDIWEPEKLTTLYQNLGIHEIIYSDSTLIDEAGNSLGKNLSDIKNLRGFDDCLCYAIGNSAPGHAMLIKRSVIDRSLPLPPIFPHDYWIGFIATCQSPIRYLNVPLVKYRQHETNVFGVANTGSSKRRHSKEKTDKKTLALNRMQLLYQSCPGDIPQKNVYAGILDSYRDFSLTNNIKRTLIFFKHQDKILAYKKKPLWRKWLFCLKMFVMIK
jgi:glycosyltransferase involved in cell wall biosynthesis